MRKLIITSFSIFGLLGFAGIALALPFYSQTQSMLPGVNDTYNIGTSSPSLLEYKNIFAKNLIVSGTCTGCGGSGTITSIATNNGITGGTITTTGTIGLASIAANSVLGNSTGASGIPSAIATSSLYTGTAGQTLAFLNGGWVGAATTTFSSPLAYSAGNVTCPTCTVGGLSSYDAWSHLSTYSATASATTSPLWLQSGLFASSTVAFGTAGKDFYFNSSNGFLGLATTTQKSTFVVSGNSTIGVDYNVAAPTNGLLVEGNVCFGCNNPTHQFDVVKDGGAANITMTSYGTVSPIYSSMRARGSAASPSQVLANDLLAGLGGIGYGTTAFSGFRANLKFRAAQDFTDTAQGTYFTFETTPIGTLLTAERVRFLDNGSVGVGTSTPWGFLSINPTALGTGTGPEFVVGSTTATHFVIRNTGFTGIGTTSPAFQFDVNGTALLEPETDPSTAYNGSYWYSTVANAFSSFIAGIQQWFVTSPFVMTTQNVVANTTTETSALGTLAGTSVGTTTLPANFWVTGKAVTIHLGGVYGTKTIAPGNITLKVKWGSAVLASETLNALLSAASGAGWDGDVIITCTVLSAGNCTFSLAGHILYAVANPAATNLQPIYGDINNSGSTVSASVTTAQRLDVTMTWATADVANIATTTAATLTVMH